MQNAAVPKPDTEASSIAPDNGTSADNSAGIVIPFKSQVASAQISDHKHKQQSRRQLVSTKELSEIWGVPESTLRYWRCAEIGPPYVKLGGRIRYDLADVEHYVRANRRTPSMRAHGG